MAYRKSYRGSFRKGYKRYRSSYRKGYKASPWARVSSMSVKDVASAALSGVNYIRGLVNSEMMKHDGSISAGGIGTGSIQHVTNIAQGDSDSSRHGNSIFARAFNLKGRLQYTSGSKPSQTVRIALVLDTQQITDSAPTYTDIYESASPWSHLNSDTVGRYKILWTKTYTLEPVSRLACQVDINRALYHHVRYNGANATDIQKGGLYLAMVSDETSSENLPIIDCTYRLSYRDN